MSSTMRAFVGKDGRPRIPVRKPDGKWGSRLHTHASLLKDEWKRIAAAVWKNHAELEIETALGERFRAQVVRFLSVAWQVTPVSGEGKEAYRSAWHVRTQPGTGQRTAAC